MARKPSLADALKPATAAAAQTAGPQPRPPKPRSAGRAGKSGVAFWIAPEAAKQLRHLAVDTDRTIQNLMEEALDDLFRKHGKHRLASAAA